MYRIFINEIPLVISDRQEDFSALRNLMLMDDSADSLLKSVEMLEHSEKGRKNFGIFIPCTQADAVFSRFRKHFQEITAGGGIVRNREGHLLLIKRQGKWDLPKGKKDRGESIEQAALREVEEECGISPLKMVGLRCKSYHTYHLEGKRILKTTYWYDMEYHNGRPAVPQEEENITEVAWFDPRDIAPEKLDTYNSIRDVLKSALS